MIILRQKEFGLFSARRDIETLYNAKIDEYNDRISYLEQVASNPENYTKSWSKYNSPNKIRQQAEKELVWEKNHLEAYKKNKSQEKEKLMRSLRIENAKKLGIPEKWAKYA